MRYVRYAFLAALGLVLITVALANRAVVSVQLLPDDIATFFGFQYETALPLFIVIFLGIVAGLLIGFVWEWIREYKQRAEASRMKREMAALKKEVARLKSEKGEEQDEVLALLEDGAATR
ncbi:lipopolysaccharide assembly protein LapA domain-containing protein [Falsihalocynthiibacter sp. SS001]|uniref:lipopolysaccharide assembly protein LapA domain-containing protein n=1 Tax=Falsihalocynthiibacter sp. SS001 TaxID=3349698 RepID=UPI0036D3BD91